MDNYCDHSDDITTCSQCSCRHGILWEKDCYDCDYEYDIKQAKEEAEHYANLDSIDRENEERQYRLENPPTCNHGILYNQYCDICDVDCEESVG